jgi:hypothetical protein
MQRLNGSMLTGAFGSCQKENSADLRKAGTRNKNIAAMDCIEEYRYVHLHEKISKCKSVRNR